MIKHNIINKGGKCIQAASTWYMYIASPCIHNFRIKNNLQIKYIDYSFIYKLVNVAGFLAV